MNSSKKDWEIEFEKVEKKLFSKDVYEASDCATEFFDIWYKKAVSFAKGSFSEQEIISCTTKLIYYLLVGSSPNFLLNNEVDEFITRNLLEKYSKLLSIMIDKPKFNTLLKKKEGYQIKWEIKSAIAQLLMKGCLTATLTQTVRLEFFSCLLKTSDLSNNLKEEFPIDIKALVSLAVNEQEDSMERVGALDVLTSIANRSEKDREEISLLLANSAKDLLPLQRLWTLKAHQSQQVFQKIIERISSVSQRLKNTGYQSIAERDLPSSLAFSLHEALKDKILQVSGNERFIVNILKEIEKCGESGTVLTEVLSTALHEDPDSETLLLYALNTENIENITNVSSLGEKFKVDTWVRVIFPFLKQKLESFSLSVSGSQKEQEIVNLLREGARVYYLSRVKSPSLEFGHVLLMRMSDAIKHGYIETERFTELCALVIKKHLQESSLDWLSYCLSDDICINHKVTRAIEDVVMRVLGVSTTSEFCNPSSFENQDQVIQKLASISTVSCYEVLCSILKRNDALILTNNRSIQLLLESCQKTLIKITSMGKCENEEQEKANFKILFTLHQFFRILSTRVPPSFASKMFELSVQTMILLSQKSETTTDIYYIAYNQVPSTENQETDQYKGTSTDSSIFCQETLKNIIQKVPYTSPLSINAVKTVLKHSSAPIRVLLADFVPMICLEDEDVSVRIAALNVLARSPQSTKNYEKKILESCKKCLEDNENLNLHQSDLGKPFYELISNFALSNNEYLYDTLELLCRASQISAFSNPINLPSKEIVEQMEYVLENKSKNQLLSLVLSEKGLQLLPQLTKYSAKWKMAAEDLVSSNILTKTTKQKKDHFVSNVSLNKENQPLLDKQYPSINDIPIQQNQMQLIPFDFVPQNNSPSSVSIDLQKTPQNFNEIYFIDDSFGTTLFEEAKKLHNIGLLMESLRVCHRIVQTQTGSVKESTLHFVSNVLLVSISVLLLPIPKSENGTLK